MAALLYLSCWGDLRVLEVTMWAIEGHYDDFTEEGDLGKEESSSALIVERFVSAFSMHYGRRLLTFS
jgi:hypothetical protein